MKKFFALLFFLTFITNASALETRPYSLVIRTIDGEIFDLDKMRGKKVMISFFTSWCKYCKLELKELQDIYEGDKNIEILAINIDDSDDENLINFAAKYSYKFARLSDAQINDFGRPKALPTLFVIDENGLLK